jgi:hypothetical protein
MMNSNMLRGHSRHAAGSLIDQVGDEPEKQIEQVYFVTYRATLLLKRQKWAWKSWLS